MHVLYSRTYQPHDAVVGGLGAWAACPLVFHISWRAGMQGHYEYEFHRVLGQAVAVINTIDPAIHFSVLRRTHAE
jgi:hypothetical protein